MPSYVKPASRIATGSSMLRPSISSGLLIRLAASRQSSSASCDHSVTSTAASAPSSASSGSAQIVARGSAAAPSATGSQARTSAPSATSRPASTRLGASRTSSVFGLKASPSSVTVLPRRLPRWCCSFPITRRFCSSLTSITAFRSWKW